VSLNLFLFFFSTVSVMKGRDRAVRKSCNNFFTEIPMKAVLKVANLQKHLSLL